MQPSLLITQLKELDDHALEIVRHDRKVYWLVKNGIDFLLAALALIIFSPIMIVVALLIKLDSSGPVFFSQDRVGVKRKTVHGITYWSRITFRCFKFRTMFQNADSSLHKAYVKALMENDEAQMAAIQGEDTKARKLVHDPRVTRLGRFLRRSSLDELPQFFNVLLGNMSLVGPRPAIPYEVSMYKTWYFKRLETKPGLTGLWQVTSRSSADFDEMVRLDIEYVERQSIRLDLKILLMTPWVVISCKHAH